MLNAPWWNKRPAAVIALDRPQVAGDLAFEVGLERVQEMIEQNIFSGDGRIGFELEAPMAVFRAQFQEGRTAGVHSLLHAHEAQGIAGGQACA